jgi:protease I
MKLDVNYREWPAAFCLSLLLLFSATCLAGETRSSQLSRDDQSEDIQSEDIAAITKTVFDYLEGINELDRNRLEGAFHPSASLKSLRESGELVVEPIAEAIARWMQGRPARRSGRVLAVDIADTQIARVVFDYNGEYTDFLTLARVQGKWRIIDKVFIRQ